jgi:hypothetical protein
MGGGGTGNEKTEFQKTMQDVADRLSAHPWVDSLEDDWK